MSDLEAVLAKIESNLDAAYEWLFALCEFIRFRVSQLTRDVVHALRRASEENHR